jgi:hypothetical protein
MISATRNSSFLAMPESFQWVTAAVPRWLSELAMECKSSQQREQLRPNLSRAKPISVDGARSTALASPNAAATSALAGESGISVAGSLVRHWTTRLRHEAARS